MVSSSYQDKIIFVKNNSRLTIHYSLNFKKENYDRLQINFKNGGSFAKNKQNAFNANKPWYNHWC